MKLPRMIVLALSLLAFAAPSAMAADEGDCDASTKSTAELRTMLASPTIDEYCPPGTVDEVEGEIADRENDGGAVAGEEDQSPPNQAAEVAGSDDLPFTGAEMGTFLALGAALIVTGLALRRGNSDR